LLIWSLADAAYEGESMEAQCTQWAQEAGIDPSEIKGYVQVCIANLQGVAAEQAVSTGEESESDVETDADEQFEVESGPDLEAETEEQPQAEFEPDVEAEAEEQLEAAPTDFEASEDYEYSAEEDEYESELAEDTTP
jgi:hypothetical protein